MASSVFTDHLTTQADLEKYVAQPTDAMVAQAIVVLEEALNNPYARPRSGVIKPMTRRHKGVVVTEGACTRVTYLISTPQHLWLVFYHDQEANVVGCGYLMPGRDAIEELTIEELKLQTTPRQFVKLATFLGKLPKQT